LFDFEKTAGGAEWIDAFARRARQADAHDGSPSLGHANWRVEHLRFDKRKIVATYGARCTHSLDLKKTEWEQDTWPYLLRTEGANLLRHATS
jgi:hypothetical protein